MGTTVIKMVMRSASLFMLAAQSDLVVVAGASKPPSDS